MLDGTLDSGVELKNTAMILIFIGSVAYLREGKTGIFP